MTKTALSCSMRHTHPAGIPCLCRYSRTSRVPRASAPASGEQVTAVTPPVSRSWLEPRRVVGSALVGGAGDFHLPRRWLPSQEGLKMQVACDGCTYPRPPTKGFVSRVGGRPASEVFHLSVLTKLGVRATPLVGVSPCSTRREPTWWRPVVWHGTVRDAAPQRTEERKDVQPKKAREGTVHAKTGCVGWLPSTTRPRWLPSSSSAVAVRSNGAPFTRSRQVPLGTWMSPVPRGLAGQL